jgi:hypothetical protein
MANVFTRNLIGVKEKAEAAFELAGKSHAQLFDLKRMIDDARGSRGGDDLTEEATALLKDVDKALDSLSAVRDELAYFVVQPIEKFLKTTKRSRKR